MNGRRGALTTFRSTLLRLVLIPTLIFLLAAVGGAWLVTEQAREASRSLSTRIAEGLAAQVSDRLKERLQILAQLAGALEVSPPESRIASFRYLAQLQGVFEGLYLLDGGLLVRAEWPTGGIQEGNDFSGIDILRRLGTDGTVSWSDSFVSPRTGRPTVSVAQPFDGGILMGNLDLQPLARVTAQLTAGSDTTVSLVDSHGTFLAHSDSKVVDTRASDLDYLSRRSTVLAPSFQYSQTRGNDVYQVTARPLPSIGWAVLVSQPQATIYQPLAPALYLLLPLVVLFVVGALVFVRVLDRRLFSALEVLRHETEGLGRGEFGGGEVRTRFQDLNAILDSFDTMRQKVWMREQDLKLGELRFRRMFEDAAVGIFHATYEGNLLDMNQAMAALLGYHDPAEAKAALGGSTKALYVRPEERQAILKMLQASSDAKVKVTTEFFHRTGAVLTVNHHLARVFDTMSGEFHLEAFAEDITDLKRAEQAVRDLNQDLEAKVLERTHHLARALEDLETAQSHLVQSEKMAALGQLIAGIAHELNTPLAAIHASNDNIAALLQRVLVELPPFLGSLPPELNRLHRRLYEAAARNIEVVPSVLLRSRRKATVAALKERSIEADEATIDSLVELGVSDSLDDWIPLLRSPQGADAVRITDEMVSLEKSCSVIASASEKAAKVINALRTFSHQAQESVFEKVNLKQGVETVLTLFQSRFKAGVTVKTHLDADVQVWGLADRLNQVWTNLVANAVQAMGDRGILEVVVRCQSGTVRVAVIDSGPGVPDAIRSRIFEPFFTTKRAGEGSGMGLDICRRIVDEHRGRIGFESRPGKTEFYVELPEAR